MSRMAIVARLDVAPARRALQRAHHALAGLPPAVTILGLGCMLLAASSDVANTTDAPRRGGPGPALLLFVTLLGAFACFVAAARSGLAASHTNAPSSADRTRKASRTSLARLLIYPVLLWSLFTATQTVGILWRGGVHALTVTPTRYGSDDMYYNHYNAWLVLHGKNPYAGEWLTAEVRYFGDRAYTPIARGEFADPRRYPSRARMDAVVGAYLADPRTLPPELNPATTHSYPAGAFLTALPTVWAGAPSIAITQIALLVALIALLVALTPTASARIALALLLVATADGARQVTGADFEIWPLAFLIAAWLLGDRRRLSAIALGVACAIKQTAWIAAPFYLIWIWRERGRTEALRRAAIAVATFLAINLPWIIASPGAWLASMALPVRLPLLPDGSGVVGLSLTGVLPLFPSWVYSLLEVAVFAGALVWYWRRQVRYPYAGLALALVPLLAAWRSSERYFELLPIAAVALVVLSLRAARPELAAPHAPLAPPLLAGEGAGG
ncbi:MAG TPA: hypothetical protein VJN88_05875 [Ktedonobacterales bacterium]|nr:hypothetical protein [Ktedonobacterales bacterium]